MSILVISKTLMYEFGMITLNQNIKTEQNCVTRILTALLFILKLKIFIKTLLMTLKWFDTSNYSKDDNRPLPIGWKIMKEFVGLRAKTWAYLLDDDSEHKEKRKEQKYA